MSSGIRNLQKGPRNTDAFFLEKALYAALIGIFLLSHTVSFTVRAEKDTKKASNVVIWSPYPGESNVKKFINSNRDSGAEYGLHKDGNNVWGVDSLGPERMYFNPLESVCPGEGDTIIVVNPDTVGTGGLGLAMQKRYGGVVVKFMAWHFEAFDKEFLRKVKKGECIEANQLIGYEGMSTTTYKINKQGQKVPVVTTFKALGWNIPHHTHTSIGKPTKWAIEGCTEYYQNGFWWISIACPALTQKWSLETGALTTNSALAAGSVEGDKAEKPAAPNQKEVPAASKPQTPGIDPTKITEELLREILLGTTATQPETVSPQQSPLNLFDLVELPAGSYFSEQGRLIMLAEGLVIQPAKPTTYTMVLIAVVVSVTLAALSVAFQPHPKTVVVGKKPPKRPTSRPQSRGRY